MKLSDYLQQLIGHELFFNQCLEDEKETLPGGELLEVGEDFICIKTEKEENGGFASDDSVWIVPMRTIISIIHIPDCKKCAVEASVENASAGNKE